MSTPESKVKKKVIAILNHFKVKSNGKLVWYMPVPNGYTRVGTPDFLVCVAGEFMAIETKSNKGKLSPTQRLEMEDIINAYGYYLLIRENNLNILEESIKECLKRRGT